MHAVSIPVAFPPNLEELLQPISADSPCGETLRYEGTFDRIREARRDEDPGLERGVWTIATLKRADWNEVEAICTDALVHRTKDLQIAVWLLEAWLKLRGFSGAREGLHLMAGLCERFWPGLYPEIVSGDFEFRAGPIEWLNDRLSVDLKLIAITYPEGGETPSYNMSDWEAACRPEPVNPKSPPRVTQATFKQSVILTQTPFLVSLSDQLRECDDAAMRLDAVLERECGASAPSVSQFRGVVKNIRDLSSSFLAQRGLEPSAAQPEHSNEVDSMPVNDGSPVFSVSGPIRTREDAYRMLAEASDFLARTEPHSPTPYLVRRAITWGGMRLEELLPELVRNGGELTDIFRLLQIGSEKKGAGK